MYSMINYVSVNVVWSGMSSWLLLWQAGSETHHLWSIRNKIPHLTFNIVLAPSPPNLQQSTYNLAFQTKMLNRWTIVTCMAMRPAQQHMSSAGITALYHYTTVSTTTTMVCDRLQVNWRKTLHPTPFPTVTVDQTLHQDATKITYGFIKK